MQEIAASGVQGFSEIVISVERIDRFREALTRICGWTAIDLPDAPVAQFSAWHVPESCTRIEQCLLVAENDKHGTLRLVTFHGTDGVLMRSSQRTWDTGGIFDFDVYVTDVDSTYRALQRLGWSAFGEPVDYAWGGFEVRQSLAHTPDGFVIGMLQPYGKVLVELPKFGTMSRAFNSAQIVRDFDASLDFYTQKLGWKIFVKTIVKDTDEPGHDIMGIPMPLARTTERRVAILHPQGINDGSTELIEMRELEGRHFGDRCVAPNLGYLALRYPVNGVAEYAQALTDRGVELYAPLTALTLEPYGDTTTFSVRSPDGAILEFYEAV